MDRRCSPEVGKQSSITRWHWLWPEFAGLGKTSHRVANTSAGGGDSCHWTPDVIAGLLAGVTVAAVCVLGYEQLV
ncbi:MAG TPA: hypothetical protein VIG47_08635, partial [Gemmatimonadaceae bacterium]